PRTRDALVDAGDRTGADQRERSAIEIRERADVCVTGAAMAVGERRGLRDLELEPGEQIGAFSCFRELGRAEIAALARHDRRADARDDGCLAREMKLRPLGERADRLAQQLD